MKVDAAVVSILMTGIQYNGLCRCCININDWNTV